MNESDIEHAQKAINFFYNKLTKKQKIHRMWWGHHLSFNGAMNYSNVPHQVTSEIKVKKFQEIALWT